MTGIEQGILEICAKEFQPEGIELENFSAQHAGHQEFPTHQSGLTHFRLRIISKKFDGITKVARHRLVYDALKEFINNPIHALVLETFTPNESLQDSNKSDSKKNS